MAMQESNPCMVAPENLGLSVGGKHSERVGIEGMESYSHLPARKGEAVEGEENCTGKGILQITFPHPRINEAVTQSQCLLWGPPRGIEQRLKLALRD